MYGLAHVAGWDPYSRDDLSISRTFCMGWICTVQIDPAQRLTTAGEELDHPDRS